MPSSADTASSCSVMHMLKTMKMELKCNLLCIVTKTKGSASGKNPNFLLVELHLLSTTTKSMVKEIKVSRKSIKTEFLFFF